MLGAHAEDADDLVPVCSIAFSLHQGNLDRIAGFAAFERGDRRVSHRVPGGQTVPFCKYQQTELSASITPTDCDSGGLATLIPCRIVNREGSVSSGEPRREASIRKTLSVPARSGSGTVNVPPAVRATGPESNGPSRPSKRIRTDSPSGRHPAAVLPIKSGEGFVVIDSYSSSSTTVARHRCRRPQCSRQLLCRREQRGARGDDDRRVHLVACVETELGLNDPLESRRARRPTHQDDPLQTLACHTIATENQFAQFGCLGDDRGDKRFEELAVDGAAEADGPAVAGAAKLGDLEGHLLLFREGDSSSLGLGCQPRERRAHGGVSAAEITETTFFAHALGGPPGEHTIEVLAS